ncbi:hypothetical protein E2C01_015152 [Portunus trituberculatus]|uniref:Uncharacterized protein n=1 Tax=Portunus trituberculatus TaxID=210409 RepID=A0A5B7DMD6_PORTR|nr:hypothetical protein [Portunus trituberculatus]
MYSGRASEPHLSPESLEETPAGLAEDCVQDPARDPPLGLAGAWLASQASASHDPPRHTPGETPQAPRLLVASRGPRRLGGALPVHQRILFRCVAELKMRAIRNLSLNLSSSMRRLLVITPSRVAVTRRVGSQHNLASCRHDGRGVLASLTLVTLRDRCAACLTQYYHNLLLPFP